MNNKIVIVVVVLIVLGAAGFFFIQNPSQNKSSEMMKETTMGNEDAITEDPDSTTNDEEMMADDTAMSSGSYIPYSSTALADTTGSKQVLFFYANWCPTCRPVDASLSSNPDQIPEGVTVIRVNYNDPDTDNEEKDLAKKYGVTYQHTFVQIDENGNEVAKWNGGDIETLKSRIK